MQSVSVRGTSNLERFAAEEELEEVLEEAAEEEFGSGSVSSSSP